MAKPKIYIDGKEGTTGLQIYDRLAKRGDIELLLIDEAKRNYRETLGQEEIEDPTATEPAASETVSGTVEAIENVVVSGNTYYYFTLTDDRTDSVYTAAITVSERLPFVQAGDSVSFECVENGSTKEVITWR